MQYLALSTINGTPVGLKLTGPTEVQAIEYLCNKLTLVIAENPNCLDSLEAFQNCFDSCGISRKALIELSNSENLTFVRSIQRYTELYEQESNENYFCDNWDIWSTQKGFLS